MVDIKEAFEIFTKTADLEIGFDQVADILRVLKFNPSQEDVIKLLGCPSKEGGRGRGQITNLNWGYGGGELEKLMK